MLFWRYGFLNALRNLGRSGIALLSMALAAGFLTNSISLSRGYAHLYRGDYRFLAGGEIAAYTLPIHGNLPEEGEEWLYRRRVNTENTNLDTFMPELQEKGFLMTEQESSTFTAALQHEMTSVEGVTGVYPYYRLPARIAGEHATWAMALQGRDYNLDELMATSPAALLSSGRWFTEEDDNRLVAVAVGRQRYPLAEKKLGVGDVVDVLVPRILEHDGDIIYDDTDPLLIRLSIIGVIDPVAMTLIDGAGDAHAFYLLGTELQIPLSTWQSIWQQAGGGNYPLQQLGIIVPDISYLEDTVVSLRHRFPDISFISVPELAQKAEREMSTVDLTPFRNEGNVSAFSGSFRTALQSQPEAQSALPLDLRLPIIVLVFLNAALVLAGNLLILAGERREEIGIFKAVGAMRNEVARMVLAEALLISGLGAIAGFLVFRLPAMFNQLTNGTSLVSLLMSLGSDLLLILVATAVASLLFGLVPAVRMASMSVLDAFRNE